MFITLVQRRMNIKMTLQRSYFPNDSLAFIQKFIFLFLITGGPLVTGRREEGEMVT